MIIIEEYREYQYPSGNVLYIEDVVEISPDAEGNHMIKSANGLTYIAARGWEHLTIKSKEN